MIRCRIKNVFVVIFGTRIRTSTLHGGGGGGVNRFSDRRISQKKLFGFRIWRIFYTDLRILLIQQIADLSNILARIVDLACNLVRILDCDFIVEILADPNLDKTIVGSRILLQIWADWRICIPLFTPLHQKLNKFHSGSSCGFLYKLEVFLY